MTLSRTAFRLLLCAALSAGAFVACGDDEEPTPTPTPTPDASPDVSGGDDTTPPADDVTDPGTDTPSPGTDTPDPGGEFPDDCSDRSGQPLSIDRAAPADGLTEQCTNAADIAIIEGGSVNPTGAAGDCGLVNLGTDDARVCALFCVAQATDLSDGCASCYAATVACSITNCLGACAADPGADRCTECRDAQGCTQLFYDCSGLPNPADVEPGEGSSEEPGEGSSEEPGEGSSEEPGEGSSEEPT
jgi:hypothetical protein